MRKILFTITLTYTFFLAGCIKNNPVLIDTSDFAKIEFDAAAWNNNAVGLTYPIFTRVPIVGAINPTTSPSITRTSTSFTLRVNLIGAQKPTPTEFKYIVNTTSTAVAGTHYTALSGIGSIPANSSFGFITIVPINTGVSSATPVILLLDLTNNLNLNPSVNYSTIGLSISQL